MEKRIDKSYTDFISEMYYDPSIALKPNESLTRNVTFQVTDSCDLNCLYCYQQNKGKRFMSKETARKAVDLLFKMYYDDDGEFINKKTKAIILDFIGGEPLLAIDIIDYICTYFVKKCLELNHPWLYTWRASMTTNGTHYFSDGVQNF